MLKPVVLTLILALFTVSFAKADMGLCERRARGDERERQQFPTARLGPLYFDYRKPEVAKADPILLIGGLNSDFSTMDTLAEDLLRHGIPVLQIELPGQGRTLSSPEVKAKLARGGVIELGDQTEALLALVRELGIERYDVLGFSYGAAVAVHLAELDPSISKLFLISSYYNNPENFHPIYGLSNYMTDKLSQFVGLDSAWSGLVGLSTRGMLSSQVGWDMSYESATAAAGLFEGLKGFDYLAALARSRADLYFVHGTYDQVVPLNGLEFMLKKLPNGRVKALRTVFGADHFLLPVRWHSIIPRFVETHLLESDPTKH